MANLKIGSKVKIVNFHNEEIPATLELGVGYVRDFYREPGTEGEDRVEVYFPVSGKIGGWPPEMLVAV